MYVIIDGDDVGVKMEAHILDNDVDAFAKTSKAVTFAINSLRDGLKRVPGVSVISSGGDSILAEVTVERISELEEMLREWQRPGEFTFSVGIGKTLRQSFIALRMAKSSGKCKTVVYS